MASNLWNKQPTYVKESATLDSFIQIMNILKVERSDEITWLNHDDVIKWKHFPRNWPFVREITGPDEFPIQRPVTRSFDVFFDLRLNKRLSKQPWGWWFVTPSCSLWRHRNAHKHKLKICSNICTHVFHSSCFILTILSSSLLSTDLAMYCYNRRFRCIWYTNVHDVFNGTVLSYLLWCPYFEYIFALYRCICNEIKNN